MQRLYNACHWATHVSLCLAQIKALKEQDGDDVRALDSDDQPVDPSKVQAYLKRAFGTRLADAERALTVRM